MVKLTPTEILDVVLFLAHERIPLEDVRLQCGKNFYDGRDLSAEDKDRILERLVGIGHK
jgi:hypothetical protein